MRLTLTSFVLLLCLGSVAHADPPADPPAGPALPTEDDGAVEPALLERPAPDQGYYFTFGAHLAMVSVVDDGEWITGLGANAFSFRIGQALTRWLDLGIRGDYGSVDGEGRTGTLGGFGFDATLRPVDAWLLRGGLGLAVSTLSAGPNSDDEADTFGAVAALELGYSFFPAYDSGDSGSFALTPLLRLKTIQFANDDSAYWAMVGIELTWWTGLPRHQLDLTLEEAFPQ